MIVLISRHPYDPDVPVGTMIPCTRLDVDPTYFTLTQVDEADFKIEEI